MSWLRDLIRGTRRPDPRFCVDCGKPLVRGVSEIYRGDTGEAVQMPYASCPVVGRIRYQPTTGAWVMNGSYPQHRVIFREPYWPEEPSDASA